MLNAPTMDVPSMRELKAEFDARRTELAVQAKERRMKLYATYNVTRKDGAQRILRNVYCTVADGMLIAHGGPDGEQLCEAHELSALSSVVRIDMPDLATEKPEPASGCPPQPYMTKRAERNLFVLASKLSFYNQLRAAGNARTPEELMDRLRHILHCIFE